MNDYIDAMPMTARILTLSVGALLLAGAARATTPGNPYEKIPARNLFGLKDPPPPPSPESLKPPPPPITLQGFTTILGKNQVLFKIAQPARPPQPAAELSKIMAEGEREGDVQVLEINLAERWVKFDNNGTIEVKNMKEHAAKPGGGTGGGVLVPTPSVVPQPGLMPAPSPLPAAAAAGGATTTIPGMSARASGLQSIPTRPTRFGPSATTTTGTATTGVGVSAAAPTPGQNWPPERIMTPEEQEIMIEVERERNKNNPNYPPLPPTSITPNPTPAVTPKPQ